MLTDEGTTIVKFFLVIDRDEQKQRLEARRDDPDEELEVLGRPTSPSASCWDRYVEAFEECLERTSTAERAVVPHPVEPQVVPQPGRLADRRRDARGARSGVPATGARQPGPRRRVGDAPPFGPEPTGPTAHRRRRQSCLRSAMSGNQSPRPLGRSPACSRHRSSWRWCSASARPSWRTVAAATCTSQPASTYDARRTAARRARAPGRRRHNFTLLGHVHRQPRAATPFRTA